MIYTHVLLVDDNEVQAAARDAILSRSGVRVVVAHGAADALELLDDAATRNSIGLMVTDHLMPGMNGPELVVRVRELLPELPILVLSGLPDAEAEYGAGEVLFRPKPFPPAELIRLVHHLLGERSLRSA